MKWENRLAKEIFYYLLEELPISLDDYGPLLKKEKKLRKDIAKMILKAYTEEWR